MKIVQMAVAVAAGAGLAIAAIKFGPKVKKAIDDKKKKHQDGLEVEDVEATEGETEVEDETEDVE